MIVSSVSAIRVIMTVWTAVKTEHFIGCGVLNGYDDFGYIMANKDKNRSDMT